MNTFLTDFEHNQQNSLNKDRKVNFKERFSQTNIIDKNSFSSPYIDFYLNNMNKMTESIDKKLQKLIIKRS